MYAYVCVCASMIVWLSKAKVWCKRMMLSQRTKKIIVDPNTPSPDALNMVGSRIKGENGCNDCVSGNGPHSTSFIFFNVITAFHPAKIYSETSQLRRL